MNRRGFTCVELVLILFVFLVVYPIVIQIPRLFAHIDIQAEKKVQHEIAVGQLRLYMTEYDIVTVLKDQIVVMKGDKCYTLSIVNQKLMFQPGTLIVMEVDDVSFELQDDNVYLVLEDEKERYWIATLPGLY